MIAMITYGALTSLSAEFFSSFVKVICSRCHIDIDRSFFFNSIQFHSIPFFPLSATICRLLQRFLHWLLLVFLFHSLGRCFHFVCDPIRRPNADAICTAWRIIGEVSVVCYGQSISPRWPYLLIIWHIISLNQSRSCLFVLFAFDVSTLVRLKYRWIKCTVINFISIIFLVVSFSFFPSSSSLNLVCIHWVQFSLNFVCWAVAFVVGVPKKKFIYRCV